jgi:hypothetical protein
MFSSSYYNSLLDFVCWTFFCLSSFCCSFVFIVVIVVVANLLLVVGVVVAVVNGWADVDRLFLLRNISVLNRGFVNEKGISISEVFFDDGLVHFQNCSVRHDLKQWFSTFNGSTDYDCSAKQQM